jgi:hypothetical protein
MSTIAALSQCGAGLAHRWPQIGSDDARQSLQTHLQEIPIPATSGTRLACHSELLLPARCSIDRVSSLAGYHYKLAARAKSP